MLAPGVARGNPASAEGSAVSEKIESLNELNRTLKGYQRSRILQTALKFRLFDWTSEPATAPEVAARAKISERGAEILLDALAALGLLFKQDGAYRNAPLAQEHLTGDSPLLVTWMGDHGERLYRRWGFLPEAVAQGEVARIRRDALFQEPEGLRSFVRAMHAFGYQKAQAIAMALDLDGVRRVLDLGGGPGTYLMALAAAEPTLTGVLIDLEETLAETATFLASFGMTERIQLVPRDLLAGPEPYGQGFDLALLSNVLHIYSPPENLEILRRTHASLRAGGRLLVHDYLLEGDGTAPLQGALFAVNMLVATSGGRAWKADQVRQWLADTGFTAIEPLPLALDSQVWICRRP